MTPERFQQVDQLMTLALEHAIGERGQFIREACGGDEDLRTEVESLLACHETEDEFLGQTPFELAAQLLADDAERDSASIAWTRNELALGRYEVLEELGVGGMGVVYAAYDPKLGRKVAIKLLHPQASGITSASEGRARLLREAHAMAKLAHPNVIAVHDVGTEGDRVFIVMEHVEGSTLATWLSERARPWREVLSMFVQAGRGLAAAHAAGILHRDFKPENVLVGKDERSRVMDFGLARSAQSPNGSEDAAPGALTFAASGGPPHAVVLGTALTEPGKLLGTPRYMAPEQLIGQPASEKTDQFGFCVALYQGLYGELPFHGDTIDALLNEIKQGKVKSPPKSSAIPAPVRQMVIRGLNFNPADRHASMEALLGSLKTWSSEPKRRRVLHIVATYGIALFVIAAAGLYLRSQRRESSSPSEAVKSLVVLPFLNASANAEMEYLSDGIAETLIDNLSQIPELRVIARNAAFRYKGKDVDLQKLGRELSVSAGLTGRVQQSGDTLVVHANLINLGTGSQIWGEEYNRKAADLLAVETDIARAITDKLRPRLAAEGRRRVTKLSTENPAAHQLYLRGRYLQNKPTFDFDSQTKAVEFFQRAIDLDPNYALAYAGLSDSYLRLGDARAEEAALKALALDDQLTEAHVALGNLRTFKMDWGGAEKELKRAIELNPNYAPAHYFYAKYLRYRGHPEQALAEFTQAVQLDPVSVDYGVGLGSSLCSLGQYDRGIAQIKESSRLEPNDAFPYLGLASCYAQHKMYQDAMDRLQYGMTLDHGGDAMAPLWLGYLAWVHALSGERDRALALVNELKERNRLMDLEAMIALVYDALGDRKLVFEWLEKAIQGRSRMLVALRTVPWSDSVRSDPRYADLIRRIGFPP